MSPLLYIIRRSFINNIKLIRRKPSKLVPILVYFLLLAYCVIVPSLARGSIVRNTSPKYFIGISTFATIIIFLFSIYSGVQKRSSSFLMSDVNLAFTSPIKPQNILMYGFIKEIQTIFITSLFILFQIPNLINWFKFVPFGVFLLLFTYIIFFVTISFISVFAFSLCSKKPFLKEVFKTAVLSIGLIILSYTAYSGYANRDNVLGYVTSMYSNNSLDYIPIIGWIKAIITQCFYGLNYSIFIYLALMILLLAIIVFVLYKLDLDFYEDVLDKSELNENMKNLKTKQMKSNEFMLQGKRKRKTRKVTSKYDSMLGKAIFSKHLLEYRKTGFGLINIHTGFLILGAIGYGVFFPIKEISIFLYFTIYLGCLSNFSSKFNFEASKPYIFLIPDSDDKKIFWATLSSVLKYVSDSIIVFTILGILIKANPIDAIMCMLVYISFGFVFTYGAVLNLRLFGGMNSEMIKGLLMFLSIIVYVLPGIIGAAVIASQLAFLGHYAMYLAFLIWNLFAAVVILQLSKGILKHIELD
ncbi:putative ABC exporter domain-containing protein [Clostridium sp. C8-1-8]|uniref:putative ABC exporter domain-containing protein n=1 Tax=Clostridium sp. C8-1-8 TaxID=2698831 RepID=UPI00136C9E49|nr:putative ABC exporter domain-containing protein [Clostridium sp. C8-1-8]